MREGVGLTSRRQGLEERGIEGLRIGGEHKGVDWLHEALGQDFRHFPLVQGHRPTRGAYSQKRKKVKDPNTTLKLY